MVRLRTSAIVVLVAAAVASSAHAQVSLSVDRLDGADLGAPAPAGLVVFDVFADVAAADAWTAAGLRATTANGAFLVYAAGNALLNPSLDDPFKHDPFVTCISKPLERNVSARFFNAGAASAGRFDPPATTATATPPEVNVTWFASPPATPTTQSTDGYIARLALNISSVPGIDPATITVTAGLPPPGSIALLVSQPLSASVGTVATTFDIPQLSGINWNVHAFATLPPATVFRYSFRRETVLPAVHDQGPAKHDATAGPAAKLSTDVPPGGLFLGRRSLDCRLNGAVTKDLLLLLNEFVAFGGGFTMEALFKWNGGGTVNSIIDYAGTEKLVIDVRSAPPTVAMRFNDSTDYPIGRVVPGQWHYVAAVFQASPMSFDGTVTGTLTTYFDNLSSPVITPGVTKSTFGDSLARGIGIGQHPLGHAPDFFDGVIHEVGVSLRALKPSQLLLRGARFRRGDPNGDGIVDITDAVGILSFLFTGGAPLACDDAADGNDDAAVDISDALAILGFLFTGSAAPPAPGPQTCGSDPTPDSLECGSPAGACG